MKILKKDLLMIIENFLKEDDTEKTEKENTSSDLNKKNAKFLSSDTVIKNDEAGVKYTVVKNDLDDKNIIVKRPKPKNPEFNDKIEISYQELEKDYKLV
jgi:hypothetical protein